MHELLRKRQAMKNSNLFLYGWFVTRWKDAFWLVSLTIQIFRYRPLWGRVCFTDLWFQKNDRKQMQELFLVFMQQNLCSALGKWHKKCFWITFCYARVCHSRSDRYLKLFHGRPGFNSSATFVNSHPVCLPPVGILNLLCSVSNICFEGLNARPH